MQAAPGVLIRTEAIDDADPDVPWEDPDAPGRGRPTPDLRQRPDAPQEPGDGLGLRPRPPLRGRRLRGDPRLPRQDLQGPPAHGPPLRVRQADLHRHPDHPRRDARDQPQVHRSQRARGGVHPPDR